MLIRCLGLLNIESVATTLRRVGLRGTTNELIAKTQTTPSYQHNHTITQALPATTDRHTIAKQTNQHAILSIFKEI
jgi:hypothetical protein